MMKVFVRVRRCPVLAEHCIWIHPTSVALQSLLDAYNTGSATLEEYSASCHREVNRDVVTRGVWRVLTRRALGAVGGLPCVC
jgi:hypothetical protein